MHTTDTTTSCDRCDTTPEVRLMPLLTGPTRILMCPRGHGAVALAD